MNKNFLNEILSQPTAPYREAHVKRTLSAYFDREGIAYFLDPIGNIVVGVSSREEYLERLTQSTGEPLRLFIAHMDHPGFHGEKWLTKKDLRVRWHGGSPRKHLAGAPVWLADSEGLVGEGLITKPKLNRAGTALETAVVRLKEPVEREAATLYGAFRFRAPVWWKKDVIYTKAADDLVGSFAVASLAAKVSRNAALGGNFLGLLTRAEEVGFIGAIGHFDLEWLNETRRPIVCVSLETSRTLPGAFVGKGPVVRLGDRATTFDPGALSVFTELAKQVLKGRHQRRIMDGGTCEATVATAFGYPCIGISVPLGNYHNQSFEGGPDSRGPHGPAPEFVHSHDIKGMITLCESLLKPGLPWDEPWRAKIEEFRRWKTDAAKLLELH